MVKIFYNFNAVFPSNAPSILNIAISNTYIGDYEKLPTIFTYFNYI